MASKVPIASGEPSISTRSLSWRNPRLSGRIPELDGIRGLAILTVLAYHYVFGAFHPPVNSWQASLLVPLRLGWSGVDLFFVLSGFLIGGILYDARNSDRYYQTFYLRRIHRIFPLYFAWLALFALGLYFVGSDSPDAIRVLFNHELPFWSYLLFFQNFFMYLHRDYGSQWLAVTWSLAIEEQFYMLLPLVVRSLSYRGIIWLGVASIVFAPLFRVAVWLQSPNTPGLGGYTLLPGRADALGLGVLIALACRDEKVWEWLASHRKQFVVAFLLLGCGVAFLTLQQPKGLFTLGASWLAFFYAAMLVLAVVNPGQIVRAVFRSQILVRLGSVAYAVYIFHQGINGLYHFVFFGEQPIITDWRHFGVTLLSLVTVLLMAALSWRFFEKPLIRRAHAASHY